MTKEITHSVIIICYNQERYIEKCISSLFSGNVIPNEIIIADDRSTDKTREIICGFKDVYPQIIELVLNNENLGIYKNLDQLRGKASGDIIHLLAGDNWYESGIFERINAEINKKNLDPRLESFIIIPNVYFYGNRLIVKRNKKINNFFKSTLRMDVYNWVVGLSNKLYMQYPEHKMNLGIWADYEQSLNVATKVSNIYQIDEAYPVQRLGSGITSNTNPVQIYNSAIDNIKYIRKNYKNLMDKSDKDFLDYLECKYKILITRRFNYMFFILFLKNINNGSNISDIKIFKFIFN